jgi:hypothetical protein
VNDNEKKIVREGLEYMRLRNMEYKEAYLLKKSHRHLENNYSNSDTTTVDAHNILRIKKCKKKSIRELIFFTPLRLCASSVSDIKTNVIFLFFLIMMCF